MDLGGCRFHLMLKKILLYCLSGIYYSKFAAIILSYPQTETWEFRNFFFIQRKAARIKFLETVKGSSPFDRYILTNAFDFKSERNKMDAYNAREVADAKKFFEQNGSLIFDGNHKELEQQFAVLEHTIYRKNIEYIRMTGTSYFSFWHFRSNAQYSGLTIDSILSVFDNTFPEYFKKSIEGNAFRQLLVAKLNTQKGITAPDFISKDIKGRRIALAAFKNKKYVLLNFWATWCVPCIKEMPLLSGLKEKFSPDLEIISIAYPTSIAEVKNMIAKQKMHWVNIYNDIKLINSYGGMGAIPRLFLIDTSGKIIYDSHKDNDPDLKLLSGLLEKSIGSK